MSEFDLHARELRLRLDAVADVQHADETQSLALVGLRKARDIRSVSALLMHLCSGKRCNLAPALTRQAGRRNRGRI